MRNFGMIRKKYFPPQLEDMDGKGILESDSSQRLELLLILSTRIETE
jgi:hypothetical protein